MQLSKRTVILITLLLGTWVSISAKEAQPAAADPVLEARVMKLSRELRCLVCQNETLADSRADLAEDLRTQIREQMKAGKSDKEIVDYLTTRYGKFILYNPPVDPTTYLLWFGPFILLLGGLFMLFRYIKQRSGQIAESPLSAEERLEAEALLASKDRKETA
jgi:cytochrome c-type biogenesis protein CcmH